MRFLLALLLVLPASAESLRYSINWQSGLSLGEGELVSSAAPLPGEKQLEFALTLDASVPGFLLRDRYRSRSTPALCSLELSKEFAHGSRKGAEKESFDQQSNRVTRQTLPGGGKSTFPTAACAKDALTFLQFLRSELAQGRVAPPQAVVFGAPYDIRAEYKGTEQVTVSGQRSESDRIALAIKGPASNVNVDVYFARDPGRTPLLAKFPTPLGVFSVELVR